MKTVIYQGKIDADFEGFDEGTIFKMSNGTYWAQAKYKYWYHYAYRPDVIITQENGRYILSVEGHTVEVMRLYNVVESRIDGAFKGWNRDTIYQLVNGQVWKQKRYKYEYKYAYCPEAVITEINGTYVMHVEGTSAEVVRIK